MSKQLAQAISTVLNERTGNTKTFKTLDRVLYELSGVRSKIEAVTITKVLGILTGTDYNDIWTYTRGESRGEESFQDTFGSMIGH